MKISGIELIVKKEYQLCFFSISETNLNGTEKSNFDMFSLSVPDYEVYSTVHM